MNSGSKILIANSSVFLISCTHQKPFQSAAVSVMGKIKEKQTQLIRTPVRQRRATTGSTEGFVSLFKISLASLLIWMGGRGKEGLCLMYHKTRYNCSIIG